MNARSIRIMTTALLMLTAASAFAQDFDISWYTVDGGGEMFSSGGNFEMSGTIAQPDAGFMSGGDFELTGGFWAVTTPDPCPGDADGDGDTDISDLGLLLSNFGAAVTPGTGGDLNFSGLVDITDLGILLADFGCAP